VDAAVAAGASRAAAPATPYKGLSPYDESDAPFFFGRKVWSEILADNLKAYRLTLLYGESGVGKSSVLRAGVARALREQGARNQADEGKPGLAVVVFSAWRQDVEAALVRALDEAGGDVSANGHGSSTEATLEAAIERCSARVGGRIFLILDQFEEYFLYHSAGEPGDDFAEALPRALARRDLRLSVLIAIREDAVARLDRFKGRIPSLFDNYLRIEHLDRASAREAIERPLERFRDTHPGGGPASIDPALVDAVLDEVEAGKLDVGPAGGARIGGSGGQVETPFLQLVLTRLWAEEQSAGSDTLRLATLERLGGAQGIVSSHLDAAMEALPPDERDIAAAAFRYLVTRSRTKIAHSVADLADWTEVPEERLTPVLEHLSGSGARILRPVAEGTYEIFHDVLADAVVTWRSAHAAGRRVIEQRRAAEAAGRRRRYRIGAGAAAVAFVAMALLLVVALVQYREAGRQSDKAAEQGREAQRQAGLAQSRNLAARADAAGSTNYELALLLARQAFEEADTDEAVTALRNAVQNTSARLPFQGDTRAVRTATYNSDGSRILTFGAGVVLWDAATRKPIAKLGKPRTSRAAPPGHFDVSFSGNGRRILSQEGARGLVVWDSATGDRIATTRLQSPAGRLKPNPDASLAVEETRGRDVRVWRVSTGRLVKVLSGPEAMPNVAFTEDGRRIVGTNYRGAVQVWRVNGSRRPALVERGSGPAYGTPTYVSSDGTVLYVRRRGRSRLISLATGRRIGGEIERASTNSGFASFSDDGRRLLTRGKKTVSVWDARTGRRLGTSPQTHDELSDIAMSKDGRTVALQFRDGSLRAWDVGADRSFAIRGAVGATFGSLSFDPGGRYLLVTGPPLAAEIWDVDAVRTSTVTLAARGTGKNGVFSAALSPRGDLVATPGAHGVARLWDARTGRLVKVLPAGGHDRGADVAQAFSPDGTMLVTAGGDGIARLWAVPSGRLVARMRAGRKPLTDAEFSPDGGLIATAGSDGRALLWRSGSSRPKASLEAGRRAVLSVAFSRDGTRLVTANRDSSAQVWETATGASVADLSPGRHPHVPRFSFVPHPGAQLSSDGSRVLLLGTDGAMRLWDTRGALLAERRGGGGELINSAVFGAGDRRVVTGSDDSRIHIFDGRTGRPLDTLRGSDQVTQVSLGRDGTSLLGAIADGRVVIWDADTGDQLAVFGRRSFTPAWSAAFMPGGRRILATFGDGTARIYTCITCGASPAELSQLAGRRVGRSLTPRERQKYLYEDG
jgi:WD40 repeat protein